MSDTRVSSSNSFLSQIKSKEVSPREYITLYKAKRSSIKEVKIYAPKLGSNGFGKIIIIEK